MKKLIALAIAAIMVLSMIPAMAFTASAVEVTQGDYPTPSYDFWSVYRDPGHYDKEANGEAFKPAGGYEYTSEGFKVTGPEFSGANTPKLTAQTSQPVDLKDGFYMEVRIDDFSYTGETGKADEWIAFAISDQREVGAGSSKYSNNWLTLIRTNEDGTAVAGQQLTSSFLTVRDTEEKAGSFGVPGGGQMTGKFEGFQPVVNSDGKQVYTLEVSWDEETSRYIIKINGCAITENDKITEHINAFEQAYVSVILHSTVEGGTANMTITKQGTSASDASVPTGSDERVPEGFAIEYGELIDASTVEENQPAMLFNSTENSVVNNPANVPGGVNITLAPTGTNGYLCTGSGEIPNFTWNIAYDTTYNAQDFPVFVMMLKNYWGQNNELYFCSGDIYGATDKYKVAWNMYSDYSQFYGEDEEYCYVVVDLSEMIKDEEDTSLLGRIHSVQPCFKIDVNAPDQLTWEIAFMGFFRSAEEAVAYGDEYALTELGFDPSVTEPEESGEENPDESTGESTDESGAADNGETADAAGAGDDDAKAETKAETKAEEESGCASVVGIGAVAILAAAAAAVALKKKD